MERCPVCQARLKQDPACPRCRADLSRLVAIEEQADLNLRQAMAALATGNEAQALRDVEASLRLKCVPLASRLRGFLARRLD